MWRKIKYQLRKSLKMKYSHNMYFWGTIHKLSTKIWKLIALFFLSWGVLTPLSFLLFDFHESVVASKSR